ncbi:ChuX/HutX family heme-like substrate-binding protein [Thiomicrospira sp. WB1]|uniref:ChuX/HutX family heme-like substrate-binding protein n=1 Tax=Thiomicrospira sp. WB1 TaxID=1685380 RepID=UPI00074B0192|nr:ChuX/HutX family heme-like substrate-binding protein [Thiomicrospira sp. WB1]KUJ71067.1 hypothetical protein AVO41_09355 [Thiomicrospira sp. WB1]
MQTRQHELLNKKQDLQALTHAPRAREAAQTLGVTEAEYLALELGQSVTAVKMDALVSLFQSLHSLGEVMALTRNRAVVFEHHGVYRSPSIKHNNLMFLPPAIDLRLKVSQWRYGFFVSQGERHSLQFFDERGVASHKTHLTKASNTTAFQALTKQYGEETKYKALTFPAPDPSLTPPSPPQKLDLVRLRQDWRDLTNAHQVNPLLKRYGLTRPQAYHCLGEDSRQVTPVALKPFLEETVAQALPLLLFAPNGTATQIHHGTLSQFKQIEQWLNILDQRFHMHVNLNEIDQAWIVQKQTGAHQSQWTLELFDEAQNPIMMAYLHPDATAQNRLQWEKLIHTLKEVDHAF